MHTRRTQLVVKANATALFVFIEGASLIKKAVVTIYALPLPPHHLPTHTSQESAA